MSNEIISAEIIESELRKGFDEIQDALDEQKEYSRVSEFTKELSTENEKLVKDKKIPDRKILKDVSTTDMVIDLALASVAKQTALKLQKLEQFLGKIEDELFKESTLAELSKADLMTLYTTTRLMRTDAFKILKDIRKETDFEQLEAQLLSMHSKKSLDETKDGQVKSLLETIIADNEFIEKVSKTQQDKLLGEDND